MHDAAASQEPLQSRRDAILQAAEAVFASEGYDRARLEDVAQRVGIRRASLLYHFRDKASLYVAVLDSIYEDITSRYRRVLDCEGPAGPRIEATVDEWLDFVAARPAIVRIVARELADGISEHSRPFAERTTPLMERLIEVITEGQAEHSLRQANALHVLMAVAGASTFLSLGGALIGAQAADGSAAIADRVQKREVMVGILRKFLGTHGPRPGVDD